MEKWKRLCGLKINFMHRNTWHKECFLMRHFWVLAFCEPWLFILIIAKIPLPYMHMRLAIRHDLQTQKFVRNKLELECCIQVCICPGAKAVFSLDYAEQQFQFRAKQLALLVMCYSVISSEEMFKPPFWLNLSQILSWVNFLVSESDGAMFTDQLKVLMDYGQLKAPDYLKCRVVASLWHGTESSIPAGCEPSLSLLDGRLPCFLIPLLPLFAWEGISPWRFRLCPYLVKVSRPTAF